MRRTQFRRASRRASNWVAVSAMVVALARTR